MKTFQQIIISPTDNGIIVKVGCRTLVWEEKNLQYFLNCLGEYLRNPKETEQKWSKKMGWTPAINPSNQNQITIKTGDTVWGCSALPLSSNR